MVGGDRIAYYLATTVDKEAFLIVARSMQEAKTKAFQCFKEIGYPSRRYLFRHYIADIRKAKHKGHGIYF